jgi:3-oxoacyl-[acyl-carrier protein] reductase
MRLDGKVALVTGAGSGIGQCIAETYAREGARVALADINGDAAKSAARTIGNCAIALRCDVSKKADIAGVVEETLAAFGVLDILVNNAGATHVNKPVLEISEAEYDRIFAVNVKGIFLACQAVIPALRKQGGGVIINIGSTAGLRPRPGLSAYNATKGAVHVLTKSLAVELAPDGIRVCAIAPVATETPLLPSFLGRRRECGRNSWPRFPWAALPCRRTSLMRLYSWPRPRPNSSPAISWRSMVAAAYRLAFLLGRSWCIVRRAGRCGRHVGS